MVSGVNRTMTEKTSQIGVRLDSSDATLLKRICKSRGEDLSDFVRRAVRTEMANLGFLNPLDKKCLGIRPVKINARGGG